MVNATVAVVTRRASWCTQTNHHLRPVSAFAQVFRIAHDRTFRQRLELLDHLLPMVHRVETMDPEHNLHLDLQREHTAKRTVLRVD